MFQAAVMEDSYCCARFFRQKPCERQRWLCWPVMDAGDFHSDEEAAPVVVQRPANDAAPADNQSYVANANMQERKKRKTVVMMMNKKGKRK